MKNFLVENFNPKSLLSWPVFAVSLGWGFSTNLLDQEFNPDGFYLERILVITVAHFAMFSILWILVKGLSFLPLLLQSSLMIPIVAIAAMSRGLIVWSLFNSLAIDSLNTFGYRVFGPITNMGLPLVLTAIAVFRVQTYTISREKLLAENERLTQLRNIVRERIRENAIERLEEIREIVSASLAFNKQDTPKETMEKISLTINEVVRPLSHRIESEIAKVVPETVSTVRVRIDWREALKGGFSMKYLRPLPISTILFSAGIVFVTSLYNFFQSVALLAIIWLGTFIFLSLYKRIFVPLESKLSGMQFRIFMVLGLLIVGFVMGILSAAITVFTEHPFSLVIIVPYFLTGITLLFNLAGSTQEQARISEKQLSQATSSLAWEIARISEEQRQVRRSISSLLHGKLQSGLTSALIRLRNAFEGDKPYLLTVEAEVRENLAKLIDSVRLTEASSNPNLSQLVRSLNDTWDGIASISSSLQGITTEELESDPVLSGTLAELYPELCFNAIKHGKASKIEFLLRKSSMDRLELSTIDNGERPDDSGRIGLGTKLLDECALEWSREETSLGTTTTAYLPFAPNVTID